MKSYERNTRNLLGFLLNCAEFQTLDSLSQKLGMSKRSVQNYLTNLSNWLEENGLSQTRLIRKPGHGIRLDVSPSDRQRIEKLLNFESLNLYTGDSRRRIDILKTLLFSEDEVTIQNLSERFYVSRSTILSDLDWATQWLSQYNLCLYKVQRRGIRITGSEISYRNAIARLLDQNEAALMPDFQVPSYLARLDAKDLQGLLDAYPRDVVLHIGRILEDTERKFDFILPGDFFAGLLTHMVISVLRIRNGNSVPKEFLPPQENFPAVEVKTANYIAKRLESAFSIKISSAERNYICIHLVGYNAFSDEQDAYLSMTPKAEHLAMELIERVCYKLDSSFSHDKMLFLGLCLHLKSAVYRLQISDFRSKPPQKPLPASWSEIYNAVCQASPAYELVCGVKPDEEELVSVTNYFLLSRRRCSSKIKALLVSSAAITPRMQLVSEIEFSFPELEIVDSCTAQQLSFWPVERFGLLISTEPISDYSIPILDLSNLPHDEFFPKIERYLHNGSFDRK